MQRETEEKRRQAAERAERERKAAQRREAEAEAVEMFTTFDPEVATRLREAYYPALIHVKKSGGKYVVEDVEKRGKAIADSVQAERDELRKQHLDPDKVFAKRRQEAAEALAAR